MCCYQDDRIEQEVIDTLNRDGQITLYKVLKITPKGVGSIYSPPFRWKPGINDAVMRYKKYDPFTPQGIHGYLSFEEAELMYYREGRDKVVVEVVCKKEDFIRAGYGIKFRHKHELQAVFTKATITQEEWDKNVEPHLARQNQS